MLLDRNADELPRDRGLSNLRETRTATEKAGEPSDSRFERRVSDKLVLAQP
jgi:hypothetical protein